jgi:hypothetical protein
MAKFRAIKNSLIAGEISPTALGRTDLQQYPHACEKLQNMIPLISGGAYRRPGTFFEKSIDSTTDLAPRVIPFVVSKLESYAIILGKVKAGNGYVYALRPTSNIAASTEGAVTGTHPYTVGSVLDTPIDDVHMVQYVQSADILYLVHPDYKPRRITRSAIDTFSIATFDSGLSGTTYRDARPYRAQNTTAITLSPSATSGSGVTLTASSALFSSSHVGAVFKIDHSGTRGCALVTAYTSATQVTIDIIVNFGATTAATTWWESSWSDYRGWPRAIGFYQGRLVYAGNKSESDSLWFSQSDNYNKMSIAAMLQSTSPGDGATTGPAGSNPFQIVMTSQQLNQIQWISPDKTLAVGTIGDEFVIDKEISTSGFGCDNAKVTAQSHYGSSYHQAVRFDDELVFSNTADHELSSLVFNELEDTYSAEPIQALFDNYPKAEVGTSFSGKRAFRCFQWDGTRRTLWCSDLAGHLFGLTRNRSLSLSMWHTHQFGGFDEDVKDTYSTSYPDPAYSVCSGSVVSLAVIPNPSIGMNDLWVVVKRKINGSWKYHVERMIGGMFSFDSVYNTYFQHLEGNYHVDAAVKCAADYPFAEDGSFAGLSHLEGEEVVGTVSNSKGLFKVRGGAVSGGVTAMIGDWPASWDLEAPIVEFGLGFSSIVKPVRPDVGSQIGSSQGAMKRITKLLIRFYKSLACQFGRDEDNLETITFREGDILMGNSPELFTGDKFLDFTGDYDRDGYVYLLQDDPLPFAVMAIVAEGQTYD